MGKKWEKLGEKMGINGNKWEFESTTAFCSFVYVQKVGKIGVKIEKKI